MVNVVDDLVELVKPDLLNDVLVVHVGLLKGFLQALHSVLQVKLLDLVRGGRRILIHAELGVLLHRMSDRLLVQHLPFDLLAQGLHHARLARKIDLVLLLDDAQLLVHLSGLRLALLLLVVPVDVASLHGEAGLRNLLGVFLADFVALTRLLQLNYRPVQAGNICGSRC